MVSSQEKLNIILMRDSGESKRMRVRRSRFRTLCAFFILCPFLAIAAVVVSYYLWEQNTVLQRTIAELELEKGKLEHTAQRLSNLESLLAPKHAVKNALTENLAKKAATQKTLPATDTKAKLAQNGGNAGANNGLAGQQGNAGDDGPGHDIFPVLDTKEVIIQNVSSTLDGKSRLRTTFDLRNAKTESISGEVAGILILNTGESIRLTPKPSESGKYKISHFKSSVLVTNIDPSYDLTNAQLILEAKNSEGVEIYRNIYPIAQ